MVNPLLTTTTAVNITVGTGGASTLSQISTSQLTSVTGGSINIYQNADLSGLTSLTNSGLGITGALAFSLPHLTTVDGSSLTAAGGATLSLPNVTSYTKSGEYSAYFEASDAGSLVDLPGLTSLSGLADWLRIYARSGGKVNLSNVAGVTNSYLDVSADATGSTIDLSGLQSIASSTVSIDGAQVQAPNIQSLVNDNLTLSNTATVTLSNIVLIKNTTISASSTYILQLAPQAVFADDQGTATEQLASITNQGTFEIDGSGTIDLHAALTANGLGIISSAPTATLKINGNLTGNTRNGDRFNPLGATILDSGNGTTAAPQLLEAMSDELGSAQSGYINNFAYGTLSLTSNTYVQLVDHADNAIGTGNECVYVNELIVPAGATLDLNGLHLYARGAQIAGAIINGTVTQIPAGGALTLNAPTASQINPAGQVTNWTFFGHVGQSISLQLNPAQGGSPAAVNPQLGWGRVSLLDSHGNILASANSATTGQIIILSSVLLPADDTYSVRVQAAPGHTDSTGNYVLSAYNVTPNVQPLVLGEEEIGAITNPFGADQWTFSANAGQQIKLDVISASR